MGVNNFQEFFNSFDSFNSNFKKAYPLEYKKLEVVNKLNNFSSKLSGTISHETTSLFKIDLSTKKNLLKEKVKNLLQAYDFYIVSKKNIRVLLYGKFWRLSFGYWKSKLRKDIKAAIDNQKKLFEIMKVANKKFK